MTEIDQQKMESFVGKAMGDASGTFTVLLASIGDRLGLFKDLAKNGDATSEELAKRIGLNERSVREWLGAMAASADPHGSARTEKRRERERRGRSA